jgi:integrase
MVAGVQAAQWRQRFFDSERLLSLTDTHRMDHQEILKITTGHPVLLSGGHLNLLHAATASGINPTDLLRAAAAGKLPLFMRSGHIRGYLVPTESMDLMEPSMGPAGGIVIPTESQMPASAVEHIASGMLTIDRMDLPEITASFLGGAHEFTLMSCGLHDQPGKAFVPNSELIVTLEKLEIVAGDVEMLRRSLALLIPQEQLIEAKETQKAVLSLNASAVGNKPAMLLSTALEKYLKHLGHNLGSKGERTRIGNGCSLLIEFEGDVFLSEIDSDRLRKFRDIGLSKVPEKENKIRLIHGSRSVTESIKAIEGTDWPIMSVAERDKRMRWIGAWFHWMKEVEKCNINNPAAALRGESVQTKAARRLEKLPDREDEIRDPFTHDDLSLIFGASWFKTGRGEITKTGTFRTFLPFYYWLPLLGLYSGGGRINELCQLHLANIGQAADGQWFVDFNEKAQGQKLKNKQSKRKVPLHPALLSLGFDKWIAALKDAGYTRLFPELKHDSEKGFGKTATKWFTRYMAKLGIPRNGTKTFHSFRHTYINALPLDIPDRMSRQLTGHARGKDSHDKTYKKDVQSSTLAPYVDRLAVVLPLIEPFDIKCGLQAIGDALQRKDRGHGAIEDIWGT